MSKASQTVPSTDDKRKENLHEIADELRDRLAEVRALADAVGAVAAVTEVTRSSLDRLRHTVVSLSSAVTDATELVESLRQWVRS